MMKLKSQVLTFAGAIFSLLSPHTAWAAKEITTMTTPDVLLSRQAVATVATKEPLDFKHHIVSSLQELTSNMTVLFKNFTIVLGVMVVLASVFQYFKYRENAMAVRLSYVSTTFFCGIILIGLSFLTPHSL